MEKQFDRFCPILVAGQVFSGKNEKKSDRESWKLDDQTSCSEECAWFDKGQHVCSMLIRKGDFPSA